MNMEEMLKQILDGQNEMKADIKDIKVRLDKVEAEMAEMKEDIKDLQQKTDVLQQNVEILMANSNRTGEYVEYLSKELIDANIIHEHY